MPTRTLRQLAIGENFMCGLDMNFSTYCCGYAESVTCQSHIRNSRLSDVCHLLSFRGGEVGQLGIAVDAPSSENTKDFTIEYLEETAVAADHRFIQIVAGSYHACGLDDQHVAWCWG
jgi:alpha-tubulin suppressor-like RCC1 family protein